MISHVPYHLRRLVVSVEDSHVATMGLNQLWLPSTISKYYMLMNKLFITMVRSRDKNPVDDKPFVNVFWQFAFGFSKCIREFHFLYPTSTRRK
jgi:hypothetical protein